MSILREQACSEQEGIAHHQSQLSTRCSHSCFVYKGDESRTDYDDQGTVDE